MNRYLTFPYFILVAGLITVLRITFLYTSNIELHFDEAQYWLWSKHFDFGYYSKPPMIAWVIGAFTNICGNAEACVRLPSPLLHLLSSLFIFKACEIFSNKKISFFAALTYITLPGVSFSSLLITTDPLLLLSYSAATYFALKALKEDKLIFWLGLGISIGIGLLSKYTMILFGVSLISYAALFRKEIFKNPKIYYAAAATLAIFLPNLIWNLYNSYASIGHTADNLKGEGLTFSIQNVLTFIAAQIGIFGPLTFALLLFLLITKKISLSEEVKIISFISALPLLIALIVSFITRAHGNWAAPSYAGLCLIITIFSYKFFKEKFLYAAIAANFILSFTLYLHPVLINKNLIANKLNGWKEITADIQAHKKKKYLILSDERKNLASLAYYLKSDKEIYKWNADGQVNDYYDKHYDVKSQTGKNFILVSRNDIYKITRYFNRVTFIKEIQNEQNRSNFKLYYMESFKGY